MTRVTSTRGGSQAQLPCGIAELRASCAPPPPVSTGHRCPMCSGSGQRSSAILGVTITCPWCGARGHVRLERARALCAQLRTKAEREQEQAA